MSRFGCAVAVCVALVLVGINATPLDDYVNAPDPTYRWTLNSTFRGYLGYTAYNIDLISQTWMTINETSNPVWRHWLTICVPDSIDYKHAHTAFMYIDGGHIKDGAPTSVDALSEVVCVSSQTISAALLTIPNEPITFPSDPTHKSRSEDSLIAFTWAHFINHTDEPIWLARMPMVKASVRAMDCIQEFVQKHVFNPPTIKSFVVAGASKRGWTTWLTGAVDKRVVAMVPMVMPILNIVPNMNHHYQAYGGWSFALDDYLDMGLMKYLNDPQFLALAAVVDPWSYRTRLTMPKLIMCSGGDEFFLPDSPQFFMNGLVGEKLLTVIPDAEHSLATALLEVGASISTFYQLIITNTPRPTYSYQVIKSNTTGQIIVNTKERPYAVTMWYAYTLSNTLRDFRLVACDKIPECIQPIIWIPKMLDETTPGSGQYIAEMDAPAQGWIGFLVELEYAYPYLGIEKYLRISSEVNIVPDVMPFPPCGDHCQ